MNYFEHDSLFAVLLNLMKNQSDAQLTISLTILHVSPKVIRSTLSSSFAESVLGSPILQLLLCHCLDLYAVLWLFFWAG